jgi:NAD-dependent deacetylase
MAVYPAAGLINYVNYEAPKYYIDPKAFQVPGISNLTVVQKKAGESLPLLVDKLLSN